MKELRIVCSDRPHPAINSIFIEVEDENGKSVNVGEWRKREDDLWELVVVVDTLR